MINPVSTMKNTQQPAANIASATITNNSNGSGLLTIQATNQNVSGTTSIKIKDSDTHGVANDNPNAGANEIEITIVVSGSVISFSGQVQPIFTNRCVSQSRYSSQRLSSSMDAFGYKVATRQALAR